MAYDLYRARTVLFGGQSAQAIMDDTWEWDGTNWSNRNPVHHPGSRKLSCMAHDATTATILLFGGWLTPAFTTTAELWAWDGLDWQQRTSPTGPAPRDSAAMAHDLARGRTVMYGCIYEPGQGNAQYTWEWSGNRWRRPEPDAPAHSRNGAAFGDGHGLYFDFESHTWSHDGQAWHRESPNTNPSNRSDSRIVFDSDRHRFVMFGGLSSETWVWDGLDWSLAAVPAPPPQRWAPAMAYDSVRHRVVMFGGSGAGAPYLQDTWTFDGVVWTQLTPQHSPSARSISSMTFDAARGRAVLFGGANQTTVLGDTWEWNGVDWIARQPQQAPSARALPAMVYDSSRRRVVLFGGSNRAIEEDTWEWDGSTWLMRAPSMAPLGDYYPSMFFDTVRRRAVLLTGGSLVQTWEYGPVTPATVAAFGTACSGTVGAPLLTADVGELPWLGTTFTLAIEPTPSNATVQLAVGFSNASDAGRALPIDLGPIGMPNCSQWISLDRWLSATSHGVRADVQLTVPATPSLVGLEFHGQAVVADATANALGFVVSNALTCRIGGM